MRFLTILSAIIFLAFACKDKATSPLRKRKANKILIGSHKTDSAQWRLVKKYDPYNKGYSYYYNDSSAFQYLTFLGDGTFKEYDKDNKSHGNWFLNKEKKKLALVYTIRNGIEIGESLQQIFFRYVIDSLYQDTLVLSIQGRHGMVKQFYLGPLPLLANQDSIRIAVDTFLIPPLPSDSLEFDTLQDPSKN